jgi:tetratricopeptide (TPR) repeat protein
MRIVALKWYHKAADLSPDDYRAPWNISAVYFEMGDYPNTATYTRRTLELVSDEAVRQKVLIRKAKAHLHLRKLVKAQAVVECLLDNDEKRHLQQAIKCMQTYDTTSSSAKANSSLVRSLPYYKPQMEMVREYYNVGHDKANTMFDPFLTDNSTATETLSFLFAGIGDARHLLQTFQAIAVVEAKNPNRRYHFTINDVKPEVFARDLLIFVLLGRLTKELPSRDAQPKTSSKNVWLILATLFYTFIGQVMPLEVFNHLQEVIEATIGALEQPRLLPR